MSCLPQLRKTDMLRKGQEGHVRAERDVLKYASLVSPPGGAEWIVRLYYSFQDRDHLYLVSLGPFRRGGSLLISLIPYFQFPQVLEYMGGGDLLNLLIERDVFEEDFTRFYVAEVSVYRPFSCLCPWIPTFLVPDGTGHRGLP